MHEDRDKIVSVTRENFSPMIEQEKGRELSGEETDLLERGKKKVKSYEEGLEKCSDEVMKDSAENAGTEKAQGKTENRKLVSYKDRLPGLN